MARGFDCREFFSVDKLDPVPTLDKRREPGIRGGCQDLPSGFGQ